MGQTNKSSENKTPGAETVTPGPAAEQAPATGQAPATPTPANKKYIFKGKGYSRISIGGKELYLEPGVAIELDDPTFKRLRAVLEPGLIVEA